jgi:hypothetical protein
LIPAEFESKWNIGNSGSSQLQRVFRMKTRFAVAGWLLFCVTGWAQAAEPAAAKTDPQIPTLKKVVGHDWAQDITSYAEMERYLKALVKAAPDRAVLVPYGKTYEGRTLYYLIIAKPEHLQRRERSARPTCNWPTRGTLPPEKASAKSPRRAGAGLAGLHDSRQRDVRHRSRLLTAYHLLADRRPETQRLLDDADGADRPLQNPDGHERFVNVYRETRGVYPDPQPLATEHTERWPSGRFNHYLFDMNRDWFLQSQRESRAKVAAYLHWQPHVYVDAHEMGHNANVLLQPQGRAGQSVFPAAADRVAGPAGPAACRRFDEHGFAYTTREMFEAFYPGYGSTWPNFQGGLAHLWEQAGVRGLVIRRDDEQTLHFRDAVRHHYVSSLVAIEFAAANSRRLVDEFYEARRSSIQLGLEGPVRDFFLLPGESPQRAAALAELLRNNGVEVQRVTKSVKADCTEISDRQEKRRQIPAGSFHVPVAQPAGRLVRVLLDRQVELKPEFIERQIQRNADRFPDEIYDVTAWSLPLAFGVDCLSSAAPADVASVQPWDGAPEAGKSGRRPGEGRVSDSRRMTPRSRPLSWLRQGPARPRGRPRVPHGRRRLPAGTLILRTSENPDTLHDAMKRAAQEHGLRIVASDTGLGFGRRSVGRASCQVGAAAQGRAAGGPPRQLCRGAHLVSVRPGLALSDHAGRRQPTWAGWTWATTTCWCCPTATMAAATGSAKARSPACGNGSAKAAR